MSIYSRRDFLKFGVALPLAMHSLDLRAATAASSSQAKVPPKRLMFICNSLGFYEPNFFPKVRGDLGSSAYLKSVDIQDKMTVFQNLFHPGMETSNHDSEKSFLTGAPSPEATGFVNTISLDQVLAQHIGGHTRFPYLAMSIYDRGWGCSWDKRGVAVPPMSDTSKIFDKLFGTEDLRAKRMQIRNDQEVLQCLHCDMQQMLKNGGDRTKVESYRQVIAEMEKHLKHEEFWLKTQKPEVSNTLKSDPQFEFSAKVRNLLELSKLAFQTDSTRVITLSLDWVYGAISVPGATGGWHTLSHHGGKKDVLSQLCKIEEDLMNNLNRFLMEMDLIEEGNGSLLDNTTVMIGSNFGDASDHTCNNLPTIVAGGGYKHQGHTVLEKPTRLSNLYLELLHRHNIDVASFGGGKKNLGLLKD